MEDLLAQDAGDSEINLKEDETGFVEPDQLEKMTDDAKVIKHFKVRYVFFVNNIIIKRTLYDKNDYHIFSLNIHVDGQHERLECLFVL